MPRALRAFVRAVLAVTVPRRYRDDVEDLLAQDYLRNRDHLGAMRATLMLISEVGAIDWLGWQAMRDAWPFRGWLTEARVALRGLRRRPMFSGTVVLVLAVGGTGLGLVAPLVDQVLLRPLPYPEPHELALVWAESAPQGLRRQPLTPSDYLDLVAEQSALGRMAALWTTRTTASADPQRPLSITLGLASPELHHVLGVPPALGRLFRPGEQGAVLLSDAFWRRAFSADPAVVGRTVDVAGVPATVVGVMPPEYRLYLPAAAGLDTEIDVWQTLDGVDAATATRTWAWLRVLVRTDHDLARVQEDLDRLSSAFQSRFPENAEADLHFQAEPLFEAVVGPVRPMLATLLMAAIAVLLIAGANVATLFLARNHDRAGETAVRLALGSSASRIRGLAVAEGALLGIVAAVAALAAASTGLDTVAERASQVVARAAAVSFDARVAVPLFALVVAIPVLAAGISSRATLDATRLRTRSRASGGRRLFVIAQLSATTVLLAGSSLLWQSALNLRRTDPGFVPSGLYGVPVALPSTYEAPTETAATYGELVQRLEGVPGIEAVAGVSDIPFGGSSFSGPYRVLDGAQPGSEQREAGYRYVLDDYFQTLGIALLEGRAFRSTDDETVVVVDRTLAESAWPGRSALGRRIEVSPWSTVEAEVVGVVDAVHHQSLRGAPGPVVYVPFHPWPWEQPTMNLAIRTGLSAAALSNQVRRILADLDPTLQASPPVAIEEAIRASDDTTFLALQLTGGFGALALVIALVGLYGLLAFDVSRRRVELGLRMALGAHGIQVVRRVVADALRVSAIGGGIGLAIAAAVSPLAASLSFGTSLLDPGALIPTLVGLTAVAAVASWLPALRAARVSPATALRNDG